MPEFSRDPLAELLTRRALAAGMAFHDALREALNDRLAALPETAAAEEVLVTARQVLTEHIGVLGQILADTSLASWLVSAGQVAAKVPASVIALAEQAQGLPTDRPLLDWDGTPAWMPVISDAIRHLRNKRLVTREEWDTLAASARQQAFTIAGQATEDSIGKVRDALAETLATGQSLPEFRSKVEESLGTSAIGLGHLENVFRTSTAQSLAAAQEQLAAHPVVADLFPYRQRLPIRDSRLSDLCYVLAESGIGGTAIFRADDPVWKKTRPPSHYQCFLPGTIVQGRFNVGLKTFYTGKVVEITTRRGNHLTVTANHPILTPAGLVPAYCLREGHRLLGYLGGVEERSYLDGVRVSVPCVGRLPIAGEHEEYPPTPIEQVFSAIAHTFGRAGRRSPIRSDDLHSDAQFTDGYVDIVGAAVELLSDRQVGLPEFFDNFGFVSVYESFPEKPRGRSRFARAQRFGPAAGSAVGSLDLPRSSISIHSCPLHFLRFGLAAKLDACLLQPSSQGATVDMGGLAERQERLSGLVATDEIVKIRHFEWSGHVYDLQSEGGWIVANNLFASNCRCGVRMLSREDAALRGLHSARRWLDTGEDPRDYVPMPTVKLPKGWTPGENS